MAVFRGLLPDVYEARQAELFFKELDMEEPQFRLVANVKASQKGYEDYFEVTGLGVFRLKPEGNPISYDDPVQGTRRRVTHSTFALGYRVTMEAMDDALYDVIDQEPRDLAVAGKEHQEILFWGLLNDAFAGTTHTTNDGLSIVNTGHTILKPKDPINGATASNQISPGIALSVTGLEVGMTMMRLTKTREDRFTRLEPRQLVIHPSLLHLSYQLMNTEKEPFTNENQVSTVAYSRTGMTVVDVPYLTDQESWFLVTEKSKHKLVFWNRSDMTFDTGKDSQTKDSLFDAMYRASVVAQDWRGIIGSQV